MKKFVLALSALVLATSAVAQCTIDPAFADAAPGLYPEGPLSPNCQLVAAKTIVGITDTVIPNPLGGGTVTVYLSAIRINQVAGIPAGLTLLTDVMDSADEEGQWGYWYNTGDVPEQSSALGCGYITGSGADWDAAIGGGPNNDGVYPIEFTIDAYVETTDNALLNTFLQPQWLSALGDLGGGAFVVYDTLVVQPGYADITATIAGAADADAGSPYSYSTDAEGGTYEWSVTNGTIVSGEGTDSIEVVWEGTGTVVLNVTNDACSGTDTLEVTVINTAVQEVTGADARVFPNPSEGLFHVLLPGSGAVDLRVLGLNGAVLRSDRLTGRTFYAIDLRGLVNGVYIPELRSATGVTHQRIVKH